MDNFLESVKRYDYIRLLFADMYGICRGKIFHTSHADKVINGSSVYSGSIACGPHTELFIPKDIFGTYYNGLVKGDLSTLRDVPWAGQEKFKVAAVFGETTWVDGDPQLECPRYIARRQLQRLEEMGLKLKSSFEAEMTLIKPDNSPVFEYPDYLDMNVTSEIEPFLLTLDSQMRMAGIDLEAIHAEFSPGQIEAILAPSWGIETADNMFLLHSGAKEIAKQYGYLICTASSISDKIGNTGRHLNFSVWDATTSENKFYDAAGEDKLSDFAHHWMAGLIEHTGALTALCCPTVNCYRRLHQFVCPHDANWDTDNRTVTYRVKNQSPAATYFENRLPSALSNPYIVTAATIAAGLDGVDRKLSCPPKNSPDAEPIANNLKQTLKSLEDDIQIRSALGDKFIDWFLGCKRSIDLKKLQDHDKDAPDQDERRKQEMDFYMMSM